MAIRITKPKHASPARKSSRITHARSGDLLKGTVEVSSKVVGKHTKKFRFTVVTPAQQRRERNSAYQFFSID